MKIEEIKMLNDKYYFKKYEGSWKWIYLSIGILLLVMCAGIFFGANRSLVYQRLVAESFITPLGNVDAGQWVETRVWRGMFDLGGMATILNCIIVVLIFLRINFGGKSYMHYKSWWAKNFPMVCFSINAVLIWISNSIETSSEAAGGSTWENWISVGAIFAILLLQLWFSDIMSAQETRPQYKSFFGKIIKSFVKKAIDKL